MTDERINYVCKECGGWSATRIICCGEKMVPIEDVDFQGTLFELEDNAYAQNVMRVLKGRLGDAHEMVAKLKTKLRIAEGVRDESMKVLLDFVHLGQAPEHVHAEVTSDTETLPEPDPMVEADEPEVPDEDREGMARAVVEALSQADIAIPPDVDVTDLDALNDLAQDHDVDLSDIMEFDTELNAWIPAELVVEEVEYEIVDDEPTAEESAETQDVVAPEGFTMDEPAEVETPALVGNPDGYRLFPMEAQNMIAKALRGNISTSKDGDVKFMAYQKDGVLQFEVQHSLPDLAKFDADVFFAQAEKADPTITGYRVVTESATGSVFSATM